MAVSPGSVSVVVACAGGRDGPDATLHALLEQEYAGAFEVLLVVPETLDIQPPGDGRLRLVRENSTAIPTLRAAGWAAAGGDYVGVLACYCVPGVNWLRDAVGLLEADGTLEAAGGPVEGGKRKGADLAGLLCEYGQIRAGAGAVEAMPLPGLNVMYRRATLEAADQNTLAMQFWEEAVHPALTRVRMDERLTVTLIRHFDVRWYSKQRFLYSRHFAARRFRDQPLKRWLYRLAVPLLPLVLLPRLLVRGGTQALRVLPYLVWFVLVWTAGELVGAWAGAGGAAGRVE